jgi:hypothetical protein
VLAVGRLVQLERQGKDGCDGGQDAEQRTVLLDEFDERIHGADSEDHFNAL